MQISTVLKLYCGSKFLLVEETGVPGGNHRPAVTVNNWLP